MTGIKIQIIHIELIEAKTHNYWIWIWDQKYDKSSKLTTISNCTNLLSSDGLRSVSFAASEFLPPATVCFSSTAATWKMAKHKVDWWILDICVCVLSFSKCRRTHFGCSCRINKNALQAPRRTVIMNNATHLHSLSIHFFATHFLKCFCCAFTRGIPNDTENNLSVCI